MSDNRTGAVLVIGDGIGSVQACLDLAHSGFVVYLVAPHPSLSGAMSPDTLSVPTNDCELCFLGPELIELQQHPNIRILAGSDLLSLEGAPGDFTARVQIGDNGASRTEELAVGAVVLAPTPKPYDPTARPELGYGRFQNVVTTADFDRILASPGPIAWLQCVGSRDRTHNYCSAICCLEATKKAMMAKDSRPGTEHHIFMMDMRSFGKGYMDYYNRARQEYGISFTRCRIGSVTEDPQTGELVLRYETETGELHQERFKMVVLSIGMEAAESTQALAAKLGLDLNEHGFCWTPGFAQAETSQPGIFVAGPLSQPKDTHDTVTQASAAVAKAEGLLGQVRHTLTQAKAYPPERGVADEPPRLGVFFAQMRAGIAGILDVAGLAEYAAGLPQVIHVADDLQMAGSAFREHMRAKIQELGLNRVIVATGTPLTYDSLFQEVLREAGLNPYLLEVVNLREQVAWAHYRSPDMAMTKAKDLLRMAVARARLLTPLEPVVAPVAPGALIIGGGVAGMNAALSLAEQGYTATLVEREEALGGNLRNLHHDLDGKLMQPYLRDLVSRVEAHPSIQVLTSATVQDMEGTVGDFNSRIETPGGELTLRHGVVIVATGGQEYRGPDYGLGQHPDIITQLDLEELVAGEDPRLQEAQEVVMIQCVGPANEYCSRVCCSVAIKHARDIKRINPEASVYILYKDVRAYGFREQYYTQAREEGVIFMRYDDDNLPRVETAEGLALTLHEYLLDQDITFRPDFLVLSEGILPAQGAAQVAQMLHVPVNDDGFFVEAHPKLRPVDFAAAGIFCCGVAHNPKSVEESITQAQAAAAQAARVLSQSQLSLPPIVAVVDQEKCTGCLTCVRICPYDVPKIDPTAVGVGEIMGAAYIEPVGCKGCGLCVGECPAKAIHLQHYLDEQIMAQIEALCAPEPA